MTIESIILLIISISAMLKAYFEWKRAKAESMRADNTEKMLKHTIRSVEIAKNNMNKDDQREFARHMRQYIESSDCDTHKNHCIVKEVTEGDGDITAILS